METIKVHVVKYPDRDNLMLRYTDPHTGRHVAKSARTADGKAAIGAAAVWQDELRNGRYKAPSRVTWEEFRTKYETEVGCNLAPKTQLRIDTVFDGIEEHINPDRVRDLTSDRLSHYAAKLRKGGCADATIASYLGHLRAALSYAVEWGYLVEIPNLPRQQRIKGANTMKGRPITGEEFDRMLANVEAIVGAEAAPSWTRLLNGLWHSGLRLGEAIALYWDRDDCPDGKCLEVDLTGKRPMLIIPAELDKGGKDRLLPIAPEFAEFLLATLAPERRGPVFQLKRRRERYPGTMHLEHVSDVIVRIGKKAGVKVNADTGKCASAHDLRRAFGQRWAARVMPQILMQLMRHADISTTMKYYVGREAQATADVLWAAVAKVTKEVTPRRKRVKNKLGN